MKKSTKSFTTTETFVDTSGFFATLVPSDNAHDRALSVLDRAARGGGRFVTTDYVIDETATLLKVRGQQHLVKEWLESIFASAACRIEWMDTDRFQQTQHFFIKHMDQDWSFTDCFSFVLMRSLGIHEALTKDQHFRQAGFNALLI